MAALAVAAGLSTATAAELEGFRVETQPAWIKPVDADLNATPPAAQVSQGRYFLLADYQSRLVEAPAEHFVHIAVRALDQTGVEEIASVQVSFDPTYESLAWHRLDVVRDGQRTSRLQSAQFRMLQREEELEYQIFDGSLTLSVVLDDVRSGDIVEYAFTRRGSNPVFGARVFGGFLLQWGVPLQRLHARLQYAADRPLQFALRNTEAQGTTSGVGKLRERSWDLQDLSPVLSEPDAPGWFNPYPRVNWSEYADWTAVEAWARLMFTPPAQPGDEVVKLAEQILAEHDAPAERLHAALRHVQSDIRYLGLEMGPGSHQPTPPAIVLERRFGDCKDKTLLLLTLLDLMHIDAHAALVNTTRRAGLNDMQPSPSAFNHVVVRAEAEGVQYWLDPTRSDQDAPLNLLYQPDFDLALVIDESGSGLQKMHTEPPRLERRVKVELDSTGGYEEPARFQVETTNLGGLAESARFRLSATNKEELQKDYLNYYANFFPTVRATAPIDMAIDPPSNRIVTTEHYEIEGWWSRSTKEARWVASVAPFDIQDQLNAPDSLVRHAPLAVSYPFSLEMTTNVRLPEAFSIKEEQWEVRDKHFSFSRQKKPTEFGFQMVDRYESLQDHVSAEDMPSYAAKLQEARNRLEITLWRGDDPPPPSVWERINWQVALLMLMGLGFLIWTAKKLYRWDPAGPLPPPQPQLVGLGGWMIIPLLSSLANPFLLLSTMKEIAPVLEPELWNALTVPGGESYHPLWAPVMLFEVFANLALLVFSGLIIALLFQRRRSLPAMYISFLLLNAVVLMVDQLMLYQMPGFTEQDIAQGWPDVARAVIGATIWVSYFSVSVRVKSTFTRRWRDHHRQVVAKQATGGHDDAAMESPSVAPAAEGHQA